MCTYRSISEKQEIDNARIAKHQQGSDSLPRVLKQPKQRCLKTNSRMWRQHPITRTHSARRHAGEARKYHRRVTDQVTLPDWNRAEGVRELVGRHRELETMSGSIRTTADHRGRYVGMNGILTTVTAQERQHVPKTRVDTSVNHRTRRSIMPIPTIHRMHYVSSRCN